MIANYLKIALRNLQKHKSHSLISISGLALGLACCLSILLFIQDDLSFDQYHVKKDRIYRLVTEVDDSSYGGIAKVNGPWGPTAVEQVPEVESMTRFVFGGQTLFENGDKRFYEEDGFFTDSTVFDIFSFEVLKGNLQKALTQPNSIVLTESLARKYFQDEEVVGKTLVLDNEQSVVVSVVIKDVPANSHFTFTYLLSIEGYKDPRHNHWTQWNQYYTYLLLKPNADPTVVAAKFNNLLPNYIEADIANSYHPMLQPLTDIHLTSHLFREITPNSDISLTYIFGAVGLLILIISSINFVNLSTARAMLRAKEVGIRKSSGAAKKQLVVQYLSESVTLCFVSLIAGLLLLLVLLPTFNTIVGKQLSLSPSNYQFILSAIFITFLLGTISGAYPAFFLAQLKPAEVLKGKMKVGRTKLRETLVVFQFAISAFLIIAVSIVYSQLSYIQNKSLGFDPTALITARIQDSGLLGKSEFLKYELRNLSSVVDVTVSGNQPGGSDWGIPYSPEGVEEEQIPPMRILAVDEDFISTFGIEVAEGRNFSKAITSDTSGYIINEEAARQLGWSDPLQHRIGMPAIGREQANVIGVVKDFHFRSLKEKIGPVLLFTPPANWKSIVTIKVKTDNLDQAIGDIKSVWADFDPAHPFDYSFFNQTYGKLYEAERRLSNLVTLFTAIGIFIACMGLFSLATFIIDQRTKEIGIRKVMGASINSISILLSKDLILLVIIGFVIAAPLGYYIMQEWLGSFAYRIAITPLVFLFTGIGILLLSWITVSFKVIKAGLSNPINSLRVE